MAFGALFSASLASGPLAWLVQSALVSLAILVAGTVAFVLWRQPARRVRIIELAMLGCLVAPWLAMIPGYPKWSIAGLPAPVQSPPVSDGSPIPPDDSAVPATALPAAPGRGVDLTATVIGLYAVGVGLGAAWWLVGIAGLARMLWKSRPAPSRCQELLDAIAGPNRGTVRLLVHRQLPQPVAAVWGRPVIVLPEALCDDEQAVRWALAHEWSHVERHDFRVWMVAGVARVVFFYHPLVWWLRTQLRVCQDYIADAAAARQAGQPEDYAAFLTARAAAGSLHPAMVGLGMGFRKSDLYRRVVMLVENRSLERRTPRWWNVLVSLVALVVMGLLPALSFTPESVAQDKDRPPQRKPFSGKKVAFVIGPKLFPHGDDIAIQEVWSERGTLELGDTVIVRGTYTLKSRSIATLLFSITHDGRKGPQPGCTLERPAQSGTVPFELELPVGAEGHLHLGFYDIETRGSFGNVYFGTYEQMKGIAHWDLRGWMNQGQRSNPTSGQRTR